MAKDLFAAMKGLGLLGPFLDGKSFSTDEIVGPSLLLAEAIKERGGRYALIENNLYSAQSAYEFLLNFLPEGQVVFFPGEELLRAEEVSSSRELMAQRLYALGEMMKGGDKILVTHLSALLRFLPSPDDFSRSIIHLQKGGRYDVSKLRTDLLNLGYHRVSKIDQSLQFAARGDVVDVFSVSSLYPIRIEFFDDEIESIRLFDIAKQTSIKEIEEANILPAFESFYFGDKRAAAIERLKAKEKEETSRLSGNGQQIMAQNIENAIDDILSCSEKGYLYRYYGFALGERNSVLSYLRPDFVFVPDKASFDEAAANLRKEADAFYIELHENLVIPSGLGQYMGADAAFAPAKKISYGKRFVAQSGDLAFYGREISLASTGLAMVGANVNSYLGLGEKAIIFAPDEHQRNAVESALDEANLPYGESHGYELPEGKLSISDAPLQGGFEIPSLKLALISARDLFGDRGRSNRFSSRFKNATVLRTSEDLRPGDYVVHEAYGIGQFIEVDTQEESDGKHRDYLKIAYAGGTTLYVPLEQFRLVRKYAGREGFKPRLSTLGKNDWKKRKEKIKERVNDLADRLVALYSLRAKEPGHAFGPDDDLQRAFENQFPYLLTPDQEKALSEIKADMESPDIMDRLLCGDVGFGKTELAFRACFKCIDGGYQAAVLCPTTILARQHYEVALQRFGSFGVRIAQLSRLVSEEEQKRVIDGLKKGEIDLVIGTHRLFAKDVSFAKLGLLVVDEEQRFGVEQKEKIKEMKKTVDVLTLSATPIPRTLQMSLVGIRPLSEINTPPSSRMPIQTYVIPYKESTIKELVSRELSRHGQVFYVHNRVETIYAKAAQLEKDVPGAKVGVVHGQMEKEEIEDTVAKFYSGALDILVCTSIVENGIDIPNANMIVVENADRFGLSQLYQIKGRVGRGDRIAYAYLTYQEGKKMNEDAAKRLKAIQEFTELGSGYRIAQRDLMIRGAGDLLGPEQAGFIDSVGLDLYLSMLNDAIEERKTGVKKEEPKPSVGPSVDAFIPSSYASASDKVELYQDLENCKTMDEVNRWAKKTRDVFGPLPKETLRLVDKKKVDVYLSEPIFEKFEEYPDRLFLTMSPIFSKVNGIGVALFEALTPYLSRVKASFVDRKLRLTYLKVGDYFRTILDTLPLIELVYRQRAS